MGKLSAIYNLGSKFPAWFKFALGNCAIGAGGSLLNRGADAFFDVVGDVTLDYIRDKISSASGVEFDNPFLKGFMQSFSMGVVSDCSSYVMGLSMKTNMALQKKIDDRRDRVMDHFEQKRLAILAKGGNKKAIAKQLEMIEKKKARELQSLDNQGNQYINSVNGAGVSAGSYTQGLGTMKSGFHAGMSGVNSDPNLLKLLNGMGYYSDRVV